MNTMDMNSMDMDMDMPHHGDMCSMNMLFTWDWHNTCVVFKWWHIKSFSMFILSFLIIIGLGVGYELLRYYGKKWELSYINVIEGSSTNSNSRIISQFKLKKSILYGLQVGYSFMLMLIFMTYNGWLMIAVVIGAMVGNRIWGDSSNMSQGMNCH